MKILYITCKDFEEATAISKKCVNMQLAACGNIFPITSCYLWENEVQDENEHVLLLKTNDAKAENLTNEIKRLHSYAVPCILEIEAKANPEYEKWLNDYLENK